MWHYRWDTGTTASAEPRLQTAFYFFIFVKWNMQYRSLAFTCSGRFWNPRLSGWWPALLSTPWKMASFAWTCCLRKPLVLMNSTAFLVTSVCQGFLYCDNFHKCWLDVWMLITHLKKFFKVYFIDTFVQQLSKSRAVGATAGLYWLARAGC